jgi:cellobiose-specific phosphotransferase system component IIA
MAQTQDWITVQRAYELAMEELRNAIKAFGTGDMAAQEARLKAAHAALEKAHREFMAVVFANRNKADR